MIYFIQDTVTHAIKIGYSTKPQKRFKHLQNSNQNKLALLYAMHGELEHESELLQRFDKFKMEGEWFTGEIAGAVSQIIAADNRNPRQPCLTILVAGEVDYNGQHLVFQTLREIHATTPVSYVVVSGERTLDRAAWDWANQNKVKAFHYYPNWRRHGRGGGAAAARRMLKAQFDHKIVGRIPDGEDQRKHNRAHEGGGEEGHSGHSQDRPVPRCGRAAWVSTSKRLASPGSST